ncbi:MAG: phosphoadenosine phosphosulfate reductase family protein [Mycoplasma sp.]
MEFTTIEKWNEAKKKLLDYIEHSKTPLDKIGLSFSGGKDSTVMMKLIEECNLKNKIKVVFFNTWMEYQAIYDFIDKKRKEGWVIDETTPEMPAPLIYNKYGTPAISKYASEMISRLQKHNFDFNSDLTFEEAYEKHPNCKVCLNWYYGKNYTMNCPKYLKENLKTNDLKIANKCCEFLKKRPVKKYNKENNIILSIVGVRQAEGGIRSQIYKTCFYKKSDTDIKHFPLFYFSDEDMENIIQEKNIELSDCYTIYGLQRTGCVGCPYGKNYREELEVLKKYEPNKYNACNKLFGKSYDLKERKKL